MHAARGTSPLAVKTVAGYGASGDREPRRTGRPRELACVMASPGLQQPAVQLLGRERECAVIDRVLADAGCGVGGALVVRAGGVRNMPSNPTATIEAGGGSGRLDGM